MGVGISKGNAVTDGNDFKQWIVGDFQKWCLESGQRFERERFNLRNTPSVEVKWGIHQKGEVRPGGWARGGDKTTMSILIQGEFKLIFRDPARPSKNEELVLNQEGDYAIWRPDTEHIWEALSDCVILTVRWQAT